MIKSTPAVRASTPVGLRRAHQAQETRGQLRVDGVEIDAVESGFARIIAGVDMWRSRG